MHLRKITKEGRVNIPVEILKQFNLNENEIVEVSSNEHSIIINKHKPETICSITGKTFKKSDLAVIGSAYISQEGFELIKKHLSL